MNHRRYLSCNTNSFVVVHPRDTHSLLQQPRHVVLKTSFLLVTLNLVSSLFKYLLHLEYRRLS